MTVSVNDFSRIITVERMAFILSKRYNEATVGVEELPGLTGMPIFSIIK